MCGCDETPTTAPITESQAIVGRVISAEVGIEVAAWQAHLVKSTIADSAGYFVLDGLPVGLFELRLLAPSGKNLVISNVLVEADHTTSLKEIWLSPLSWPLYDVYPHDSTRGVQPLSLYIRIMSTAQLDLLSLPSSVHFVPALQGTWNFSTRSSSTASYYYDFVATSALDVATRYTLAIGSTLATAGGQLWGDSLNLVFFTDSLRLLGLQTSPYSGSSVMLFQPRRDFSFYARFNALVNPDSLNVATTFTPPIEGVWLREPSASAGMLKFFHTGSVGLRAEQTYVVHMDGDVALVGSSTASDDLSASFQTQPVQVIASSPGQGEGFGCASCGIDLRFNSEMDTTSVASAFSLQTLAGSPVTGTLQSGDLDRVYFHPDSMLTVGEVYVARLSTIATNLWGDRLKEPFALYFRVVR
jgi:hypothetical protein